MNIGSFEIGAGKTFIIAECCSNIIPHIPHLYNLGNIVKQVASTGADVLKVQLYHADHFPENERASKKRTEFPRDVFPELVKLCHERGLACGASVFDKEAIDVVVGSGGDFLKLAMREWNNDELFASCRATVLPILSSYDCTRANPPATLYQSETIFLACVPEYPSGNIRVPYILADKGWSSHTDHWLDCLIAVSRRAIIIEKHVKFAANDYEAGWSLYPEQFQHMVKDIRWVEESR